MLATKVRIILKRMSLWKIGLIQLIQLEAKTRRHLLKVRIRPNRN